MEISKVGVSGALVLAAEALSFAGNNAINTARAAAKAKAADDKIFDIGYYSQDKEDAISKIGTPIYGRIIFGSGEVGSENTYYDYQGVKGTYTTMQLDSAVVTANFNQIVIKTQIQGRRGTVKEYISSGDMDISITGVFSDNPDTFPEKFVSQLNALLNAPTTIPINNKFLNLLGINTIVFVDGCQLPQSEGSYSNQRYVLRALSDDDPDTLYV